MTNDPLAELRAARPTAYETWGSSQNGLEVMHRALRQGVKDRGAMHRRGRLRAAAIVALGSAVVGGIAAQAVGVPGFRDEPSKESLVAEAEKGPLFPVDGGAQPNEAQTALAARITDILTPDDSKGDNGVPPQFVRGIVGVVGTPATGYTLVVGKGVDARAAARSVLEGLPPKSATYLHTRVAEHSAAELERVWRAVANGAWLPSADTPYSLDVDATSGQIEVAVDRTLPLDARDRLQKLGGDAIKIVDGGKLQRY
jgi:hypothetical protein